MKQHTSDSTYESDSLRMLRTFLSNDQTVFRDYVSAFSGTLLEVILTHEIDCLNYRKCQQGTENAGFSALPQTVSGQIQAVQELINSLVLQPVILGL